MSVLVYSDQTYCQYSTVIGYNIEIIRKKIKIVFSGTTRQHFYSAIKNDGLLFKTQPLNLFHQLLPGNYLKERTIILTLQLCRKNRIRKEVFF